MKEVILMFLACVMTLSNSACGLAADDEDARLGAFFKEYLDESFRMRPMDATRLGDHRFDHILDDLSPAARGRWKKHWQKTLNHLPKRIDYHLLPPARPIHYESWQPQ